MSREPLILEPKSAGRLGRIWAGLGVFASAIILASGLAWFAPAQMPPPGWSPGGGGAGGGSGTVSSGTATQVAKYTAETTVGSQSTATFQSNGQLYVQGSAANDAMIFGNSSAANGSGIWGRNSASGGQGLVGEATHTGAFPFTVMAPSGQTAALTRWMVNGSPVASVDSAGVGDFAGIEQAGDALNFSHLAGTAGVGQGGTGQTTYTKGDLLCASDATTLTKLAVGANDFGLIADSVETCGVKWAARTVSRVVYYQAAGCQGTAASTGFNTPTANAPAAACVTFDTDKKAGVLDFDQSTDESVFGQFELPVGWTGTLNGDVKWRTTATSGNAIWTVQTACLAAVEQYSDISWNSVGTGTVTAAAQGVAGDFSFSTITGITVTGCAAGEMLFWWFYRDANAGGDTLAADASLLQLRFSFLETL